MIIITTLLLSFFALAGCEGEPDVIEENLYQTLVAELAVLNQMDENLLGSKTREEKREQIFNHYGVTEEYFTQSHKFYQSDIDAQMKRMQKVQDTLRAVRDSVHAADRRYKNQNSVSPDTLRDSE